ncbi:hypothetical protein KBI51_06805 [Aerococcaceae bacterium zg-ZUI334]|uniref:hypothetical protein n=1 Tax=Aerococcaceae bacterium zg-252 TaxID=2796928 RepID=UPI001B97DC1F|nr:hypothetical protein [Aerococcaceae bacterium zg-ZUI334]
MRVNLYIHHDTVTSHIMTRGINFRTEDFETKFIPENIILAQAPTAFGHFDMRTNFKILRGKQEVLEYMAYCQNQNVRMSNWIDFESVALMHQLSGNEIAEILYLFHANQTLRSAFFYKLQNNYVYLVLPNGLVKTYYRHVTHFYPRFQRVMQEQVQQLVNETKSIFSKKSTVSPVPEDIAQRLAPLFSRGLKVDVVQAYLEQQHWIVPLYIIEDELTFITVNQPLTDAIGHLSYSLTNQTWEIVMQE